MGNPLGDLLDKDESMHRWTFGIRLLGTLVAASLAAGCASTGPSQRREQQPILAPATLNGGNGRQTAAAPTTTAKAAPAPTTKPTPTSAKPATPTPPQGSDASAFIVNNPQRCAALRQEATLNPPLFEPTSIFNTPVACLSQHPASASWATRWYEYGNLPGRTNPARRGEINIAFDAYSTPIYDAAEATTNVRVFHPAWAWQSHFDNNHTIPWNPSWRPAPGNDAELTIVDYATGKEWGLWGVMLDNWTECLTLDNVLAGYRPGTDLCVWVGNIGYNEDGSVADGRRGDGYSKVGDRGMGRLLSRTLLPTLDEIERGSINHALNMETYATMFGPGCTKAQVAAGDIGVDCGYAVAPATRLELPDGPLQCGSGTQPNTAAGRQMSIPEGMRFALNKTDAEIEAWLDTRKFSPTKRNTARIFAVAMRDYGWIISDSTCWSSSMAVEGVANPKARKRWAALGINDPSGDGGALLEGLIGSADDVIVLQPNSPTIFTTVHGAA